MEEMDASADHADAPFLVPLPLLTKECAVLLVIHGGGDPTIPQIAAAIGRHERQVYRALSNLERSGYLTRIAQGGAKPTQYQIHVGAVIGDQIGPRTIGQLLSALSRTF
jgi:DNA-binding IclR family transcriptional regulator